MRRRQLKNTATSPAPVRACLGRAILIISDLAVVGQTSRLASRFIRRGWLLALFLACSSPSLAADFVLEDIQGRTHRLADYRGKWVLVNFWATWCPPCLSEIPELVSLHDAHKDKDLMVIGIAMQSGSRKIVADFALAHDISYPVVLGDFKSAKQIGAVDVLPSSFLYNPRGEQVSYQAGAVTRAAIETYIKNKKLN
jgi:thiol-disulfide isomerase/thioredoxin